MVGTIKKQWQNMIPQSPVTWIGGHPRLIFYVCLAEFSDFDIAIVFLSQPSFRTTIAKISLNGLDFSYEKHSDPSPKSWVGRWPACKQLRLSEKWHVGFMMGSFPTGTNIHREFWRYQHSGTVRGGKNSLWSCKSSQPLWSPKAAAKRVGPRLDAFSTPKVIK